MIGVDLGLNVGSVIRTINNNVKYSYVLKFNHEKESSNLVERIHNIAIRFMERIQASRYDNLRGKNYKDVVAIEEPVFSWGRKNPVGFAKNVKLIFHLEYMLWKRKIPYVLVNNKAAKKVAGYGGKDKAGMIEAYRNFTGSEPGHSAKYGKETLADAFFIAKAGYYKVQKD